MLKNKKYKKETLIIIGIVIVAILSAVFIKRDSIFQKNKSILQLPRITAPMQASDGTTHNLLADFYVDIPGNSKDIPSENIKADITQILTTTNYDLLTEKDSLNSVMKSIQDQIKAKYPDIAINHVYVSNFLADFKLSDSKSADNSTNKTQDILNGLTYK